MVVHKAGGILYDANPVGSEQFSKGIGERWVHSIRFMQCDRWAYTGILLIVYLFKWSPWCASLVGKGGGYLIL